MSGHWPAHSARKDRPERRAWADRLPGQVITSLSQASNLTIVHWGGIIAASIAAFASALPYLFEPHAHCWATAISGAALYVVQSSIGYCASRHGGVNSRTGARPLGCGAVAER